MTDLTLEALQAALAPIAQDLAEIKLRVARLEVQCTSIPLIWAAVGAIQEQIRHIGPIRAALKDLALTRVKALEERQ